jgi:glutamate synthase domain-containing protein 3
VHPTHWLIYAQVGADLLADWDNSVSKFVRVMPTDYKAVLEKMKAEEVLEATA